MKIISHRGFWIEQNEKNTKIAFQRSFSNGFGIETDVRDYCGDLVISHDIPISPKITFDDFVSFIEDKNQTLAINIKSDGLVKMLVEKVIKYELKDVFVFDMSVVSSITEHAEWE